MKQAFLLPLLLAACGFDVEPSGDVVGSGGGGGGGTQPTVSFALDILPLFNQDCMLCHGGAGGLDLDSWDALMVGGISGAVVIPGFPEQSLLPRRLDGTFPPVMPLDAPTLTTAEIDRIKQWILEGALNN